MLRLHGQGTGERPVRLYVVGPVVLRPFVERRRPRDVPQVVVREPQDPVRDPVVVPVVALLRDVDVADALRGTLELATPGRNFPVTLGDGGGDPGGVVPLEDPAQHRHEAAGATMGDELAVVVTLEANGPAVGRHDERGLHRGVRVATMPLHPPRLARGLPEGQPQVARRWPADARTRRRTSAGPKSFASRVSEPSEGLARCARAVIPTTSPGEDAASIPRRARSSST